MDQISSIPVTLFLTLCSLVKYRVWSYTIWSNPGFVDASIPHLWKNWSTLKFSIFISNIICKHYIHKIIFAQIINIILRKILNLIKHFLHKLNFTLADECWQLLSNITTIKGFKTNLYKIQIRFKLTTHRVLNRKVELVSYWRLYDKWG